MAIDLITVNPRELLDLLKSAYYDQTGETLTIGSSEFAIASTQSYVWSILLNNINEATRNRFIDYARGEYLDAIAANYGILERPQGYRATAEFIVTATGLTIQVPANAIVVEDNGGLQFTNPYKVTIRTGSHVILQAVEAGEQYNGIPEGKITNIVEGASYITAISNTTMTAGGTDDFSDDDVYREWLKTEIKSFAGAGTYTAYEARAKNADSRILDSYVLRQTDNGYEKGKVKIFIYADPTTDFGECLYLAQEACEDESFRPIGDLVEVSYSPVDTRGISATIQVTYPRMFYAVAPDRNTRILNEYIDYVKSKINRPFVFEELCERLKSKDSDGVYALDAKTVGIQPNSFPTPVYPIVGRRLYVTSIPISIYYTDRG